MYFVIALTVFFHLGFPCIEGNLPFFLVFLFEIVVNISGFLRHFLHLHAYLYFSLHAICTVAVIGVNVSKLGVVHHGLAKTVFLCNFQFSYHLVCYLKNKKESIQSVGSKVLTTSQEEAATIVICRQLGILGSQSDHQIFVITGLGCQNPGCSYVIYFYVTQFFNKHRHWI